MKLFRMVLRAFRDAAKSIVRNFNLSLASIVCITITLILLGSFLMASLNVNHFADSMRQDVTIVAFVDPNFSQARAEGLSEEIEAIGNVASFTFMYKDEVKESLMGDSEIFDAIFEGWPEGQNPLYSTFSIKVEDVTKISATANAINDISGVQLVEYGANFVSDMLGMFKTIERVAYITIAALVLVTAFLISNTIKLTIASRSDEIGIMRLVGASNATIKLPFVIEGLFLGLIGSIIPIGVVMYGYTMLYERTGGIVFTPVIRMISPEPFIYSISLLLLVIGMLVGMWGSARAVRRHLKI